MILEIDYASAGESHIRTQKSKARILRQSQWWKNMRARGCCYYCEGRFPAKSLTMDHKIPLSRGGNSSKHNIVVCCKECNNQKKNLLPVEWGDYLQGRIKKIKTEQETNPVSSDPK